MWARPAPPGSSEGGPPLCLCPGFRAWRSPSCGSIAQSLPPVSSPLLTRTPVVGLRAHLIQCDLILTLLLQRPYLSIMNHLPKYHVAGRWQGGHYPTQGNTFIPPNVHDTWILLLQAKHHLLGEVNRPRPSPRRQEAAELGGKTGRDPAPSPGCPCPSRFTKPLSRVVGSG